MPQDSLGQKVKVSALNWRTTILTEASFGHSSLQDTFDLCTFSSVPCHLSLMVGHSISYRCAEFFPHLLMLVMKPLVPTPQSRRPTCLYVCWKSITRSKSWPRRVCNASDRNRQDRCEAAEATKIVLRQKQLCWPFLSFLSLIIFELVRKQAAKGLRGLLIRW
jgi:hypothetical protein